MGSPPGSPYAVSVRLMTTTIFSASSTSLQGAVRLVGPYSPVQRQPPPLGRTNNIRSQRCRGAPQACPSRPLAVLIRLKLVFLTRLWHRELSS